MPIGQVQFEHWRPANRLSPMYRVLNDLDYRDSLFVYPAVLNKNGMNEDVEDEGAKPYSIRCSFQEHAIDSEQIDPGNIPNRYARMFTRYKGYVKWHDRVVCRGISMRVVEVLDRFDNVTGQYHHTELRGRFLAEEDSVDRDTTPPYAPSP